MAFVNIIADAAIGIKAARVMHHDRRFLDRADIIQSHGQRAIPGFLAKNHFDEKHLFHRREKMNPNKIFGLAIGLRERGYWQGGRVRRKDRAGPENRARRLCRGGLDRAILENRLDHQIGAREVLVIGGWFDS